MIIFKSSRRHSVDGASKLNSTRSMSENSEKDEGRTKTKRNKYYIKFAFIPEY